MVGDYTLTVDWETESDHPKHVSLTTKFKIAEKEAEVRHVALPVPVR
jgi:hypothetical protein